MQVARQALKGFLDKPPAPVRFFLFHGSDEGLAREMAETLVGRLIDVSDPFARLRLTGREVLDDPPRLADEMGAISLTGGRRAIWIEDVEENCASAIENALSQAGDALVLAVCPALQKRSKLRTLAEGHSAGAAIALYREDGPAELADVRALAGEMGLKAEPDVLALLAAHAGADRRLLRQAIERLSLYGLSDDQPLSMETARELIGDASEAMGDSLTYSAFSGDLPSALDALRKLWAQGTDPIGVLRILSGFTLRLHQTRCAIEAGGPMEGAMKALRPPVFWKQTKAFAELVRIWPSSRLAELLGEVLEGEKRIKQGAGLEALSCERLVLAVASRARHLARR